MARNEHYVKMIHTNRWQKLRRDILTSQPLCQRCLEEGLITAATEVHHIRPVEEALSAGERERLMYDPHNLRALCHSCHVRTHTELGRCGKAATRKRNDKQVEDIIKKYF